LAIIISKTAVSSVKSLPMWSENTLK